MKKEELNYFENFVKNSEYALQATEILKEFCCAYDIKNAEEYEKKVHSIENEADRNLHKILNYLIKDFLPPIDREDVIRIAHKIDDIVDSIDEIVINLNILNVDSLRENVEDLIELLLSCTQNVVKLLKTFSNIKKYDEIKKTIIDINLLEEKGDKLFQKAIKELYRDEKNPINIIVWTTMYNCFENSFDACESVADCVEEILMKNS